MDVSRNDMLGELANDAALERTDFLVQATEQLAKFLDRHRERVAALGGLTLIDDDPDYLSIAPDMTFRVRSAVRGPGHGRVGRARPRSWRRPRSSWSSTTRPRSTPPSPRPPARPPGLAAEPTAADDLLDDRRRAARGDVRPRDRRRRLRGRGRLLGRRPAGDPRGADDEEGAALAMYNLALDFQERSQQSESSLIEQFEEAAASVAGQLGDL